MAEEPTDPKPEPEPDPDAGAKAAVAAERKARRDAEKAANDLRAKLKELEDRDKSESEKLAGKIAEAEKRATDAEARALRMEVASAKGLTAAQAKRLVGASQEELEADADELLSTFGDGDKTPSKPTEALKGGGDPTAEESAVNVREVVDSIPRGF